MADQLVDLSYASDDNEVQQNYEERELSTRIQLLSDEIRKLSNARDKLINKQTKLRRKRKRALLEDSSSMENSNSGSSAMENWQTREFVEQKIVLQTLQDSFGMRNLRGKQEPVLRALFAKRDVFCVMPTGGGKSLCYQLPAVVQGGWTVVVSPLLSLSHDQVIAAEKFGIQATMLSGSMDRTATSNVYKQLFEDVKQQSSADSVAKMLFVTPEMIVRNKKLLGLLEKLHDSNKLTRIVIDEAHCCSTMGHSFRPEYQKLFILRQQLPRAQLLCCTATATADVEKDVIETLMGASGLGTCVTIRDTFNRTNLEFRVEPRMRNDKDAVSQLVNMIRTRFSVNGKPMTGIVYCPTRPSCETTSRALNVELSENGKNRPMLANVALAYHAYMDPTDKEHVHHLWKSGSVPIICATSAFGMGIDLAAVRFVIHLTIPGSMEAYCQEAGRAGRDGLESTCVLLYSPLQIPQTSKIVCDVPNGMEKLLNVVQYCEKSSQCRRLLMSQAFGESYTPNMCPNRCDVCQRSNTSKLQLEDRSVEAMFVLDCVKEAQASMNKDGGEVKITMLQLLNGLGSKGPLKASVNRVAKCWKKNSNKQGSPLLGWSDDKLGKLMANMLIEDILDIVWSHNAFATNTYVVQGSLAFALRNQQIRFQYMDDVVAE